VSRIIYNVFFQTMRKRREW